MRIDLSKLARPDAIEVLSYEQILAEIKADFIARWPDYSDEPHDPITKVLEVAALRELVVRQSHNEKASQVMLAFAKGSNLDALGALPWLQVERLLVVPADNSQTPPVSAKYESDDDFRKRLLLAYSQLSTAGSIASYEFHARAASGLVKDVAVKSLTPGEVLVTILSADGNGVADSTLQGVVLQALNADKVRPLTDYVTVQSVQVVNYSVNATLSIYAGASGSVVLAAANKQLASFIEQRRKIGLDITLSGLYASLHVKGVQGVVLTGFDNDLLISDVQVAYCVAINLSLVVINE